MNAGQHTVADPYGECVCLNLRMSARALSHIYDEALRPLGLKTTQFSMLRFIRRFGPITFQDLAERLVLDQTTLPRSLRVLEKEGLVRIEHGEDRRERLVSLTPKGGSTLEKALPHWKKAQGLVKERFSAEKLDVLMRDLAVMRKAVAR